jgi:hypothetical protein
MQESPNSAPRWVLHPALFAAAFVLEVALSNHIEPAGFGRALTVAILVGIGLTVVAWVVARDRWLGGLIASAIVLCIVTFIPLFFIWRAVGDAFGSTAVLVAMGVTLAVVVAVPVAQRARVRRGAPPIRQPMTTLLNRFATILILVGIVVHVGPDVPANVADALRQPVKVAVSPAAELPDIYVILLDGYPRSDVLERKFGIDNSGFLANLQDLGFDVGTENHSNYNFTQLTLASMFQMRYLDEVPSIEPLIGLAGGHVNALRNALIESPAFAALKAAGYEIIVTQPGYEHVALRGAADRVLEHGEMNELERDVLKRTWLLYPLGSVIPTLFTGGPRDRVIHAFDDLEELAAETQGAPRFTWVHVPAPHLPLILDAEGRALELAPELFDRMDAAGYGMSDAEFAAAYAGEVTYLNSRVLHAVRTLQHPAGRADPIIIVMSDHGFGPDLADPVSKLSNLFAAYTPEAPGLLADAPTPVNLMARLLNRFLGTDFPTSPDRYFLADSVQRLLVLAEVLNPS